MTRIAVIDFETTGSTPGRGARATEIAMVMVEGGQITGSFQSLMNGGVWIPPFITQLTGISNDMVAAAPPAQDVMREAHGFVGGAPMVAHNAAFDQSFWRAELARADLQPAHAFACTVRLSRRLFPNAPNHKLGTLLHYHGIASAGPAHRALADASVTAHMLLRMQTHLQLHWDIGPGVLDARVPSLLLQPLVENALRHGIAARTQAGRLDIRIHAHDDHLSTRIANDLPDYAGVAAAPEGVGLGNLRERLALIHPGRYTLRAGVSADRRFEVEIAFPLRRAPGPAP